MKVELILSIYATIVSTLVFIWRIYTYVNDKKSKLVVSQRVMNSYPVYQNGVDFESRYQMLEIKITNKGESSRFIERPSLQLNKSNNTGQIFSLWTQEDMNTKYPKTIQPGERLEFSFPLDGIKEVVNNGSGATKYRAYIEDTLGNTFKSKWLTIK